MNDSEMEELEAPMLEELRVVKNGLDKNKYNYSAYTSILKKRNQILYMLRTKKCFHIEEIVKLFNYSESHTKRIITELCKNGILVRVFRGLRTKTQNRIPMYFPSYRTHTTCVNFLFGQERCSLKNKISCTAIRLNPLEVGCKNHKIRNLKNLIVLKCIKCDNFFTRGSRKHRVECIYCSHYDRDHKRTKRIKILILECLRTEDLSRSKILENHHLYSYQEIGNALRTMIYSGSIGRKKDPGSRGFIYFSKHDRDECSDEKI